MSLPAPGAWPTAFALDGSGVDLLRRRAESTPERTALVDADRGETWTYEEFDRRVDRLAAEIRRVVPDAGRVGFLLDARPAFATAYFAVARLGRVAVPLNVRLAAETLSTQAAAADARLVVCDRSTAETAANVAPPEATVASVDEQPSDGVERIERPPDATVDPASTAPDATVDPASTTPDPTVDPASTAPGADRLVLFTSGTTGDPKGVRLTRRNLVASAVGSAFRLGVATDDRWLICLPMYHMGGLAPLVRSTLYGTTTVIQRSFDAERTAAVVEEHGVTGVSVVPTVLTRLLDADWDPPESLRFALLGGAPASEELLARCADCGVPACPTYGLTETASQVATATPAEARARTGTVGRPLRGTNVRIRTDDGTLGNGDGRDGCDDGTLGNGDGGDAVPGETGEIVVAGATVTPGYLDEGQTDAAFDGDWLRTGDLGYADEDGRLWVVGRVDDVVVTGGENVHPARVADAVRDVPGVADVAVVGLPDDEWGERVAALVVPEPDDQSPTRDAVRSAVRDDLADFAAPKTVAFADELPRTASGTVDREAVAERLRDDGPV